MRKPRRPRLPRATAAAHKRANHLRKNLTPAEIVLWDKIRHNRLGAHFRCQFATGPYVVDFVCLSRVLIIEVDGPWHDLRSKREMRRTKFLESPGFRILRFSNEDVFLRTRQVVEEIRRALEDAESESRSDSPA